MIRKATILDVKQVQELIKKTLLAIKPEDYATYQKTALIDHFMTINFENIINDQECYMIVFESKILAFSSYNSEINQITNLYVDPDYQGWYFGEKLLAQLEKIAQENSYLEINVDAYLSAVDFFQLHKYHAIKKNNNLLENKNILTYFMKKYF